MSGVSRPESHAQAEVAGVGFTATSTSRAICGILSCGYNYCQRTSLFFLKANGFTSKLLATRWAGPPQGVPHFRLAIKTHPFHGTPLPTYPQSTTFLISHEVPCQVQLPLSNSYGNEPPACVPPIRIPSLSPASSPIQFLHTCFMS